MMRHGCPCRKCARRTPYCTCDPCSTSRGKYAAMREAIERCASIPGDRMRIKRLRDELGWASHEGYFGERKQSGTNATEV